MFRRTAVFAYSIASYAVFFVTYLYAAGFLGNFLVPKSIDSPRAVSLTQAILVDAGLLLLFALQHSVMARPAFKRWWTRYLPEPAERSTYVLLSSVALILLFWLWQPIGGHIWHINNSIGRGVMYGLFAAGLLAVLVTTFLINHFDLFGLRQGWLYFRNRPYTPLHFVTPGPYKVVRHPLYVGWLLTFWATPDMTAAHAFFAICCTAYILVAIPLEERDLATAHPAYQQYRQQVPMLIPRTTRRTAAVELKPTEPDAI
jgi:protein-S-isoprenylcysteine O-methyltransferase Ste14